MMIANLSGIGTIPAELNHEDAIKRLITGHGSQRRLKAIWRALASGTERDRMVARVCGPITKEESAEVPRKARAVGEYPARSEQWLGWCSCCGRYDEYVRIVSASFGVCHAHRKKWWVSVTCDEVGARDKDQEGVWRKNYVRLSEYQECRAFDYSVFIPVMRQLHIPVPKRGSRFRPTMEQKWLLAQRGYWAPPRFGADLKIRSREECRAYDEYVSRESSSEELNQRRNDSHPSYAV